jgi:hypothetical protein
VETRPNSREARNTADPRASMMSDAAPGVKSDPSTADSASAPGATRAWCEIGPFNAHRRLAAIATRTSREIGRFDDRFRLGAAIRPSQEPAPRQPSVAPALRQA